MENEKLLEETFSEDENEEFEENTGKSIQTIAKVIQTLGIICSIIIAILLWFLASEAYYSDEEAILTIAGFVYLVVGIIISVISGIFIRGFGELVENSQISRDYLCSMQNDINELKNKK